ncbi:Sec-independent protein translocase subunit TatA/TatB [Fangia hongkongensis]|uniref:Sec-independent protein translocase subunit TatA/TatB n=1 Tax=Fangia hongkongensis TaxID=270495 RepID=UPI000367222D|nr:twin-arginine translocase TatA/TatE family subunit [Fangia hongkongensis]
MFGLSGPELLLSAGIGLLVLGPEQLKQVVRFIAKCIRSVRKIMSDISTYLESTIDDKNKPN